MRACAWQAAGDAMWFQGEPYRHKMRHDVQNLRDAVAEQRKRHEIEPLNDPFAPPGREAVLMQREAAGPTSEALLRVDSFGQPPVRWGRAARGGPVRPVEPTMLSTLTPLERATTAATPDPNRRPPTAAAGP